MVEDLLEAITKLMRVVNDFFFLNFKFISIFGESGSKKHIGGKIG